MGYGLVFRRIVVEGWWLFGFIVMLEVTFVVAGPAARPVLPRSSDVGWGCGRFDLCD